MSEQHLRDQEAYFENLVRWYALRGGDYYGLAAKSSSGEPSLSLHLSLSGSTLAVQVVRCQALTSDYCVVEINPATEPVVKADTRVSDAAVPVYISLSPQAKREAGQPDPGEDIPRPPYRAFDYRLHLSQPPDLPVGHYLQVAEINVAGGSVAISDRYIPPCLSLSADARLMAKAQEFRNRIENLLKLAATGYQKVAAAPADSELQMAVREALFACATHTAAFADSLITTRNAGHPAEMVALLKRLFRLYRTALLLQPRLRDHLNEKFFSRQGEGDVRTFEAAVDTFLLADYDHRQIALGLAAIDDILARLRGVLGFLAQEDPVKLDRGAVVEETLTYNGRTYRLAAFGEHKVERIGELTYLSINLAQPMAVSDALVFVAKELLSAGEWSGMRAKFGINEVHRPRASRPGGHRLGLVWQQSCAQARRYGSPPVGSALHVDCFRRRYCR